MKMGQCVPKRRHIKFRGGGITQKKVYNILTNLNLSVSPSLKLLSFNTYHPTNYIMGELQDLLPLNHR